MTVKANRVTWLRRTVQPHGSQGPDGAWRARCRYVAQRATALKARVLHVRAWNHKRPCIAVALPFSGDEDKIGGSAIHEI